MNIVDILAGIPTKITTPPKKCCLKNPKRRNEHKGPTAHKLFPTGPQIASFRSIAWPRYLSWLGFTMGALSGLRRKLFGGAQAGEGEKGRFPVSVWGEGAKGDWEVCFVEQFCLFPGFYFSPFFL